MKKVLLLFVLLCNVTIGWGQAISNEGLLQDYYYFFSQLEQIHPDPTGTDTYAIDGEEWSGKEMELVI